MKTITVRVRVGEPTQDAGGDPTIGLEFLDGGLALGPGQTLHLSAMFPIGPGDVGLVLPMRAALLSEGEEPPPSPPFTDENRQALAAARAELARARAAGEIPPPSAEALRLLAAIRAKLDRGASVRVGVDSDEGYSLSNRIGVKSIGKGRKR